MILVHGKPVVDVLTANAKDATQSEALLERLLNHPVLAASSNLLKETEVLIIKPPHPSGNEDNSNVETEAKSQNNRKFVYLMQKEFATANPLRVEMVGTDELTTCIGVVMRDPSSGLTSVGHFDSAKCLVTGLNQLTASLVSTTETTLQIHLVGAYDDRQDHNNATLSVPLSHNDEGLVEDDDGMQLGWSWPLALKMIHSLQNSTYKFEMETCCILWHNTSIGPSGYACPTVGGVVVETSSGRIMPARFEPEARGPDTAVRGVYTSSASWNPGWRPSLLSPYETFSDTFVIYPFKWSRAFERYAAYMLSLSDTKFLHEYSTSPHAESSDFVSKNQRIFSYVQNFPHWEQTFPNGQSRTFKRTSKGGWVQESPEASK